MAPRRLSGKAMLAAAAALAAIAGAGAGVWIATSGDDDPRGETSVATAPGTAPTEAQTTPGGVPPETQTEPPPESERDEDNAPPATEPTETTPSGAQKTRFPRDKGKSRAKRAQRRFAVPPAREFSGTGNARLGTVDVREPSVVKWSTKGRFELRFGREAFPIIAPTASGQLVVPPYSFDLVRVIASGRWKISITPQR